MQKKHSFISDIVNQVLSEHSSIEDLVFVLPSKRASYFLQKQLSNELQKTSFAPEIYSIESFVEIISELRICNHTQLLFIFYEAYKEITDPEKVEPIESVAAWASPLLSDFNEIDAHIIDTDNFFSYLSNIKEVEHWYLQEEKTQLIKDYISFWNSLPHLYFSFIEKLINQGLGYQGLVYREAVEALEHYSAANKSKKHIFLGFNALNQAEQSIIQTLLEQELATIYWDADAFFMQDNTHSASLFMRSYKKEWKYYRTNPFQQITNHFDSPKDIKIIGASDQIGQAKAVGSLLQNFTADELENTAIVLGDENLLIPILRALPDNITSVNITMGVSLKELQATYFFKKLMSLHATYSEIHYYKDVFEVLQHPLSRILLKNQVQQLTQKITKSNKAYLTFKDIVELTHPEDEPAIKLLFKTWGNQPHRALNQIKKILICIAENKSSQKDILLTETLSKMFLVVNQLEQLNDQYQHLFTISAMHHFFDEIVNQTTLDFKGEPHTGLQIMGVLETRSLDYETVIITSLNEGIFPAGKSTQSFIPFDLKKAFKLPTFNERDAIYTYHFYRLLHRAKNAYLLYNNQSDGLNAAEKSRFLMQLQFMPHKSHTIQELSASAAFQVKPQQLKCIPKTPEVMASIQSLLNNGISPSALVTYIRNPIDFYYRYVLKIKETESFEETIEAKTLGNILHDVLQDLYTPVLGIELSAQHIEEMQESADALVQEKFRFYYEGGVLSSGKNLIIYEVAKRYIHLFLKIEKKAVESGNVITINQVEQKVIIPFDIPELPIDVNLKGTVDRIETRNGKLHITDYKTGLVQVNDLKIKDMNQLIEDYKYSKAFQVLMYSKIWANSHHETEWKAGVISFKKLKNGFIPFTFEKDTLINAETLEAFSEVLKQLILELCNPDIPFIEKEV